MEIERHCERSKAIQGGLHRAQPLLDCFVASLLAMTIPNSIRSDHALLRRHLHPIAFGHKYSAEFFAARGEIGERFALVGEPARK